MSMYKRNRTESFVMSNVEMFNVVAKFLLY